MTGKITKALAREAAGKVAETIKAAADSPAPVNAFTAENLAKEAVSAAVASPAVQSAIESVLPRPIDWWKSQAVVGNVVGIILSVAGVIALFKTGTASAETLSVPVGTLLANGVALYGRISTTRPIAGTEAAAKVQSAAQ